MSFVSKLSLLAALTGLTISTTASATGEVWDSADPWGSATLTQYAEWNTFASAVNNASPEFGAGATLTVTNAPAGFGGPFLDHGNIYTFFTVANFQATLSATSGVFDVYLRAAAQGNLLSSTATLNGVSATSTLAYASAASQGAEQEVFWKWSNVSAASLYTFNFSGSAPHVLLDQLSLATVTAVPEPETYAMMVAGLGLVGFMSRKRSKKLAAA